MICSDCGTEGIGKCICDVHHYLATGEKRNIPPGTQEGDMCYREGCRGILLYPKVQNCSCHINPPCSACVDNKLTCDTCGWEEGDD